MSNTPPNDRSGRRPAAQPTQSLSQIGRDEPPLLLPITPASGIDEITRLVRDAGAARIELLVPDGTTALQSISGNETLREAAKAAGVRVTLFTADEKTTHAARFAKLDVVSVGGTVAGPQPGAKPRRPTGQQRVVQPPVTPRPPQAPPQRPADARSSLPPAQPVSDDDFLTRLDAFDRADVEPAAAPPRLRQSDEGALLFDTPGDVGVPRPADNDSEWETFAQGNARSRPVDDLSTNMPTVTRQPRRDQEAAPESQTRAPRPSLLGALFGFLPLRRRPTTIAERYPAQDDDGPRMSRPERTPEEEAARRRQARNFMVYPIVGLMILLGVLLIWAVQSRPEAIQRVVNSVVGGAPTLAIEPPRITTEARTFDNLTVPLVAEPVTDASSINVQGLAVTAPITVALQGTSTKTAVMPIGRAEGSIVIRNRSSQAITIPRGTVVTGAGQRFTFANDVIVPPRQDTNVGSTFGFTDAALQAELPGAQGNIPAGSITAIPEFSGNLVVEQAAPFTGGTDAEVPVVSPDDINPLLPAALTELEARGIAEIKRQVDAQPGFVLISSETTPEITPTGELLKNIQLEQFTVFPPIGEVVDPSLNGRFTLQMTQRFQALASPANQPIDQQLQQAVANLLRLQGQQVTPEEVAIAGWQRSDQGLIVNATVTPRGGYQRVTAEQEAEIEQRIRNQPRAAAEQYLNQLREDGVIGNFTLPADMQTVPDNVDVVFNAPDSAAGTP